MNLIVLSFGFLIAIFLFIRKYKLQKKPGAYILAPFILFAPFALMMILLGLSGADKENYVFISVGYLAVLIFSFTSILKLKFLWGSLLGFILIAVGLYRDDQFWKKINRDNCAQWRADLYCIESTTGFECTEKSTQGALISPNICTQKFSEIELNNQNRKKRKTQVEAALTKGQQPEPKIPNSDHVAKATDVYTQIVKKILVSANPESLNFEEQLGAIYNCISDEFEDPLKAESITTYTLQVLAKTSKQIEKYKRYSSSKGRVLNPNLNIAGLPAGDKKLNCYTLDLPK
ncbi:MAG: hypothetical protein ACXVCY_16290 [Pseudobdellovibrionaceae bacterium]